MRKRKTESRFSQFIINIFIIFAMCGFILSVGQRVARLQSKDETKTENSKTNDQTDDSKNKTPAIHSAGRGNPFINFKDGTDLISLPNASNDNSQPSVLTAADFDSDGIADLVTADISGNLQFYRGNDAARRTGAVPPRPGDEQSFDLTNKTFTLAISPDFLFAGDFTADGHQDLLGAAKGANFLVLLRGDGAGNFAARQAISVTGQISALTAGEIGRRDGQTDLAVAFTNKSGAFLAVFEHPESAFKHKPEIFKLSAPANEIAIGNLDEDFYADIAVAGGNDLTIVHGRGQAYPWDLIPQSGITRPPAVVAGRRMPFAISALTVGRFGAQRGETLAILGGDGNIYRLEPNRREKPSNNKIKPEMLSLAKRNLFLPADAEIRNLAILSEPNINAQQAAQGGKILIDSNEISGGKFGEFLQKKQSEAAEKYQQMSKEERAKLLADALPKKAAYKERAKQGYLRSISGKPSTLANWAIETLVADSALASAAASNVPHKMLKVNVSSSNLDDILLVDSTGRQLSVVSRQFSENNGQRAKDEGQTTITNLEVENGLQAVLPVRLNQDALSDLVVLRRGASVPGVVMTAPMNNFVVTSDNEDGDCQGANLCSLRNAITLANQTPGVDSIFFTIGSATIAPASPLPVISEGVTISGPVNGNFQPLVEISGTNLSGQGVDGLKIRTSNTAILGLAVNEFTSIYDPGTGSSFGGNGITIESTLGSPNNGNNFIAGNYLGTDKTGSLDKGNGAAGLNIFDAGNNQIGSASAFGRNIISGNGSGTVRGAGIALTAGNNNLFYGNLIGLNSLGTGKLGNSRGLFFTGANNEFGGDGAGEGNTVSGNQEIYDVPNNQCDGRGIEIPTLINFDTGEQLTLNNNFKGNRIGTNPAGTVGLGNCFVGISTNPYTQTNIGSITQNGRNIVSDNGRGGIYCGVFSDLQQIPGEGGFCSISGNNIGTDITGNIGIGNDGRNVPGGFFSLQGVVNIENSITFSAIGSPGGTTPNGACTGFCNLISGNENIGFAYGSGLVSSGYGDVGIFNNFVGTNQSGNAAIPNDLAGIVATHYFGTTFIGGDLPNLPVGNLVSGNRDVNILVGTAAAFPGFSGSYSVLGNRIGTDVSGNFSVQPAPGTGGSTGIVGNASIIEEVYIGSAAFEGRNIISGHKGNGTSGGGNGIIANGNGGFLKIVNNLIGLNSSLNPLGNQANGIYVNGFGVRIGGTDQEANQIAYNGTNGQNFAGVSVDATAFGATIRNNLIHDNIGLGIDLQGDGVTENDCQDADFGANNLQNYPVLFAPVQNGDGTLTVNGFLRSRRGQTYTLDFYRSQAADASTYGEGAAPIGSQTVTTDGNGFGEFSFISALPVSTSLAITATATDAGGSTSEFSCAAGVCFAGLTGEMLQQMEIACAEPIIVNVVTDEPDANTADSICDVDTSDQIIQCTLRAAIQEANARPGYNQIRFDIPGGGVQTISVGNNLPEIDGRADLDATSQNGYTNSPLIKLDGGNLGGTGLKITGNVTVSGFSIVGFGTGITLRNASGAIVEKCFIGVNADGQTFPAAPMAVGIDIRDASTGNLIGGYADGDGNIISNNETGIYIGSGSYGNFAVKNIIGVGSDPNQPIPNNFGIVIDGSNGNSIGGKIVDEGNIIAGNSITGILIHNSSGQNQVSGNYLGVSPLAPENNTLGNLEYGIVLAGGANNNLIGGNESARRNVIGYSQTLADSAGIYVAPDCGVNNSIFANEIGVFLSDADNQYHPIPNRLGILIRRGRQTIGQRNEVAGNLVGQNLRSGIVVQAQSIPITEVIIHGNDVGTNGDMPLGNGGSGIFLEGDVSLTDIFGNIVSGNTENGVTINGGYENEIVGNHIGTNSNGDLEIPNQGNGVLLFGNDNQIGDEGQTGGNLIAGNGGAGIVLFSGSVGNTIRKNLIGTNLAGDAFLRNLAGGVIVAGSDNTLKENLISGNSLFGVTITPDDTNPAAQNNRLIANKIGTNIDGQTELANGIGVIIASNADSNFIEKGNLISGNHQDGIIVGTGAINTIVSGNLIGTTADGQSALGNLGNGVLIRGSNTLVGGAQDTDENVISGNLNGIVIEKDATSGSGDGQINHISNNLIGLSSDGAQPIANLRDGILLLNGANYNLIGFSADANGNPLNGTANFIAGNSANGIRIVTEANALETTSFNVIAGNQIGVAKDEVTALANAHSGIAITDSPDNLIGSVAISPANVISGNTQYGVYLEGNVSTDNRIINNHIGITGGGEALGNGIDGLRANGAPGTVITNNNIGGNLADGIVAENIVLSRPTERQKRPLPSGDAKLSEFFRTVFNIDNLGGNSGHSLEISGNRVGVFEHSDGSWTRVSNQTGIRINNSSNTLVGTAPGSPVANKNIVSGNAMFGISLEGLQSSDNTINNSIVGSNENGDSGLGNRVGISIAEAIRTKIGDVNFQLRTEASRNADEGARLARGALLTEINNSIFESNGSHGILITDQARQNSIKIQQLLLQNSGSGNGGGNPTQSGNLIKNNGGAGVRIDETAGQFNQVYSNTIFGNAGLGIDLGAIGRTSNDPADADEGANRGQNYPAIVSRQIVNDELVIGFNVDSAPVNSNYGAEGLSVEFFKADSSGEGERFLGSARYTVTDYNGALAGTKTVNLGNINVLGITPGDLVTATATDADGNTSEFFPPFAPTAARVTIGGRISTTAGQGIGNVRVILTAPDGTARSVLTNSFGNYRFENVEVGQIYTVSAAHKKYRFEPPVQVVQIDDARDDLNFTSAL